VLDFLYTAVSWVLLTWHKVFNALGLDPSGGLNWSLSIVFLVVTARLLLFRLFIKQVHYMRHMQEMQPKIKALQDKYKNDKAELNRQMMQLQQEQGFNPLSGCLPMFLQIPVFIGLFHVLRHLSNSVGKCKDPVLYHHTLSLYGFTPAQTCSAAQAKLFGAPLAASLHDSTLKILQLGGSPSATRTVTLVLVVISAAATFLTQRYATANMTTTPTGSAATIQRLMRVFIPVSVLFSGFIFPLGVLLYWFTSNTWTLGQQLYINKFHPHTPSEQVPAGEVGKTLAPKPGQRPVRDKPRNTTVIEGDVVEDAVTDQDSAPRSTPPRPGQRPPRPNNRPAGKRPSQSKKRR
jgi:YidC/Oxa1 family membrane protein insertase